MTRRSHRTVFRNGRSAARFIKSTSSLSRHARRPHVAPVLVKNHRNDLSARVTFEVKLRIDNPVKELALGAREDREGGLPRELCFEMIVLEHDIE
jgi:hypothetical protein